MLRRVRLIELGFLSALALVLLALPVAAQDDEDIDYQRMGAYVGANLAFADSHFHDNPNFGTDWGFNLRVGYRAREHFAIELEYERFGHFISRDGNPRIEIETNAVTMNAKIPFLSGPLQPFVNYGLGLLVADNSARSKDSDFTMRMGGGLDIWFSDHISLNTTIDYVRGFGAVSDFRYMTIGSGLAYRF